MGISMKYLRALFAICLIPVMAGCSSSGQVIDGWNNCVIGGAVAGAAGGVLLDGSAPGAIVGAGLGAVAGTLLCGDGDSDGDGVSDDKDKCPGTPAGVAVDASGCPIDTDGDGVADYMDKCPKTPGGVNVDANGCALDSDGDGVPDFLDLCPATPNGAKVDKHGCPTDSDKDGVPDYADKCGGTPKGTQVDADGCAIKVAILYIHFAFDSAQIMLDRGDTGQSLATAIQVMSERPNERVRIVGFADSTGAEAYNQQLSERRAAAVRQYLINNGGVAADRMEVEGRGEAEPAVSNQTREGRATNRRVELELLK
jgi:OmpA-OmpF porin, OOP family